MQITRETDYAVRCLIHLSGTPDEVVVIDEIAGIRDVPRSFLAKILQKLSKAGIVTSYRGVKGGFQLARKPKDITLLDVVEAIEGPVAMNKCVVDREFCDLSRTCSVHPVWVGIRAGVENLLKGYNFEMLAANRKK
ncbi:MAG: Rrf2 family transcriptional regulator [Thermodesulfovibrionia bacterium]|nr:Rrf2 family transcriptional regulator [Thermodesulfovibrionia bacterium]